MRVASLLPSAAEIVCLLGQGESLVGRGHEDDFPKEQLQHLPVLTGVKSKFQMDSMSSKEIDDAVTESLKQRYEKEQATGEKGKASVSSMYKVYSQCAARAVACHLSANFIAHLWPTSTCLLLILLRSCTCKLSIYRLMLCMLEYYCCCT